jgi:hypothetical protein
MSLAAVADAVASKPRVRARTKTSFYVTMSVFMTAIVSRASGRPITVRSCAATRRGRR